MVYFVKAEGESESGERCNDNYARLFRFKDLLERMSVALSRDD